MVAQLEFIPQLRVEFIDTTLRDPGPDAEDAGVIINHQRFIHILLA